MVMLIETQVIQNSRVFSGIVLNFELMDPHSPNPKGRERKRKRWL